MLLTGQYRLMTGDWRQNIYKSQSTNRWMLTIISMYTKLFRFKAFNGIFYCPHKAQFLWSFVNYFWKTQIISSSEPDQKQRNVNVAEYDSWSPTLGIIPSFAQETEENLNNPQSSRCSKQVCPEHKFSVLFIHKYLNYSYSEHLYLLVFVCVQIFCRTKHNFTCLQTK